MVSVPGCKLSPTELFVMNCFDQWFPTCGAWPLWSWKTLSGAIQDHRQTGICISIHNSSKLQLWSIMKIILWLWVITVTWETVLKVTALVRFRSTGLDAEMQKVPSWPQSACSEFTLLFLWIETSPQPGGDVSHWCLISILSLYNTCF